IRVYKKTTIYSESWSKAANDADTYFSMNISDIIPLALNDEIKVYVRTDDSDAEIYAGATNSYISLHKIS
ncbi:MAG: hypothetical protein ABIG42_03095, partial [bacterium]